MSSAWGDSWGACETSVCSPLNEPRTCGTGTWTGPFPGDPDGPSSLRATSAFGGIDVNWDLGNINSHALAHVKLFRGPSLNFDLALPIATVGGTHFYDKLATPGIRYYWVQGVSVNGTVGDLIGPASAEPQLLLTSVIEAITGEIDSGVLAQSLKQEIAKIDLINGDLFDEIQNRLAANELQGAMIQSAQSDADRAISIVYDEIIQRTEADSVLLSAINTMAGQVNDNQAAIQTESTLRISDVAALAQQLTTVQSASNDNLASVQQSLQTNINLVDGVVEEIGALYTAKVSVNGLIGGFGVYNDGKSVEAGFDVDTFWIGRTQANKRKPFVISNGVVYLDKASISVASIDTLKLGGNAVIVPSGDVVVDSSTTNLQVTVNVTGLASGEYVPLHVHYGIVLTVDGQVVWWDQLLNGQTQGGGDQTRAGHANYVGAQFWVTNGNHTVGMRLRTNPTGLRRLSILAQVVKR